MIEFPRLAKTGEIQVKTGQKRQQEVGLKADPTRGIVLIVPWHLISRIQDDKMGVMQSSHPEQEKEVLNMLLRVYFKRIGDLFQGIDTSHDEERLLFIYDVETILKLSLFWLELTRNFKEKLVLDCDNEVF